MPRLQKQFGYRQGRGTKSAASNRKKALSKAKKANKPLEPNVKSYRIKK